MPDHPAVGTYVCCPDEDTMSDIDHHHVIVKAEGSQLRWCNRAGVSWRLTPRADGDLDVDKECPYYEGGYTVCKVVNQVYNGSTLVTSLLGPSGETYGLSGRADPVCYGDLIKLVNRYDPMKGYLDTCNHNATNTGFGVQTSSEEDRDGGSGTWQIVRNDLTSSTDPEDPDPVNYGDMIKLVNQYDPAKGYLDTCNHNGTNTGFGVETSSNPNRDGGSGTWQIVWVNLTSSTDTVGDGHFIKLVNQYDPAKGYLDTCNHNATNTGFGVETSSNPNRDGCSGTWQLEVVGGERLDCVAPWVREQADEEDEE
eukprot:scaffold120796_cov60-Phaeocystis_antarctica.AAC.2